MPSRGRHDRVVQQTPAPAHRNQASRPLLPDTRDQHWPCRYFSYVCIRFSSGGGGGGQLAETLQGVQVRNPDGDFDGRRW